ncbi:MAG TPA: sensor histidine kinase [Clostridiales bacterium]|nr:sensor histidine kinase [Clostridiales bacterium]
MNYINSAKTSIETIKVCISDINNIIAESQSRLIVYYKEFSEPKQELAKSNTYNNNITNKIDKVNSHIIILNERRTELYQIMCFLYSAIIDNDVCLEKDLVINYGKTNALAILEAQERERHRIAQDLHDTIIQSLVSIIHKIEFISTSIDNNPTQSKLELEIINGIVKKSINEMRVILYDLMPMSLDDLGLTISVKEFIKDLMKQHDIHITVISNEEPLYIVSIIKLTVFRIIQEACNNVIKHANAKKIRIDIIYDEDELIIALEDDGNGFNIDESNKNKSYSESGRGLAIMKERAYLLSGCFKIVSSLKKGTKIEVRLPLEFERGER